MTTLNSFISPCSYLEQLQELPLRENDFVIVDSKLNKANPKLAKLLKKHKHYTQLKAGEGLKKLERLPKVATKLCKSLESFAPSQLRLVWIGGGSLTDFGGFFSSIYKRGVQHAFVPSTWLSAMDAAHGGKTAINCKNSKNQLGSFYPPSQVWMVQQLLNDEPKRLIEEAKGEYFKSCLLSEKFFAQNEGQKEDFSALLWSSLPQLLEVKYKVVAQDPMEKKGIRSILNLGHTLGHALEGNLKIAHGRAVAWGCRFALVFSKNSGKLPQQDFNRAWKLGEKILPDVFKTGMPPKSIRLSSKKLSRSLESDKKKVSKENVNFVFLASIGRARVEEVSIKKILEEIKLQGFCRKKE